MTRDTIIALVLCLALLLSVGLIALDRAISEGGFGGGQMEIMIIQFVKRLCGCQIHFPGRVHVVRKAHLGEDHQRSNG